MELARPVQVDLSRRSTLNEVLWSDPTDSDERVGCHPNARGPNTVSYGPDRVEAFCELNNLKLLVRPPPAAAHAPTPPTCTCQRHPHPHAIHNMCPCHTRVC